MCRHISRCTTLTMTMRGPQDPLTYFSGDGHHCWPHAFWKLWGLGGVDWMKGPLSHPPCGKWFPEGHPIFPGWCHLLNHPRFMGLKMNPFPWSPLPGSKWDCPSVHGVEKKEQNEGTVVNHLWMRHYSLQPCMQPVTKVLYNQCQHYASPLVSCVTETSAGIVDNDGDEEEESNSNDNCARITLYLAQISIAPSSFTVPHCSCNKMDFL